MRVLVVDDDSDTREMLKAVPSECQADVITAASAAEAIKYISRTLLNLPNLYLWSQTLRAEDRVANRSADRILHKQLCGRRRTLSEIYG